jgi:hypothetical protein
MDTLTVGGRDLPRRAAFDYAQRYLTSGKGFAYPSYDGYDRERAMEPLRDTDLLAPVLLNVRHLSVTTFEELLPLIPRLREALDGLPVDLSLVDAGTEHDVLIARLFSVLDDPGVWGAQGTVLAKILHRKRPALIPLYDANVWSVYVPSPVPRDPRRSWEKFFGLFLPAVRDDLRRELPFWEEIAALAPTVPITPLRALDIVAWWEGNARKPPVPDLPDDLGDVVDE